MSDSPEILIKRKNVVLDATMLSSLMACARMSDFRFNQNLVPIHGKSKSLEMGSAVHIALEYFHKSLINGAKRDLAIANGFTACTTYFDGCPGCAGFERTDEIPKPLCGHKPDEFPGCKLEDENKQTVITTLTEYWDYYKNDSWVHLEAEVVKQKLLYSDDEIRILWKAKFDHIVDTPYGIKSVDHKTFAQRRDSTNLNNQFTGQCILLNSRDMIINKIGFQKTLPANQKFTRPVISYTEDRLDEWINETLPYYAKMYINWAESDYWPPNYTQCENKYGFCDYKEVCESNRNMRAKELQRLFKVGKGWDITND